MERLRSQYEKDRRRSAATANMAAVTQSEFDFWFGVLCGKIKDRFMHVRRAFRILDEDKSGKLDRPEFRMLLRMFNLESAPEGVFDRLVQMTDESGDGL